MVLTNKYLILCAAIFAYGLVAGTFTWYTMDVVPMILQMLINYFIATMIGGPALHYFLSDNDEK